MAKRTGPRAAGGGAAPRAPPYSRRSAAPAITSGGRSRDSAHLVVAPAAPGAGRAIAAVASGLTYGWGRGRAVRLRASPGGLATATALLAAVRSRGAAAPSPSAHGLGGRGPTATLATYTAPSLSRPTHRAPAGGPTGPRTLLCPCTGRRTRGRASPALPGRPSARVAGSATAPDGPRGRRTGGGGRSTRRAAAGATPAPSQTGYGRVGWYAGHGTPPKATRPVGSPSHASQADQHSIGIVIGHVCF